VHRSRRHGLQLGNPVEGERDSVVKANTVPVGRRTPFPCESEQYSVVAWSGMFSTGEPQKDVATLDNYPALKLHP